MLLQIDFDQFSILSCLKPRCCLIIHGVDSWVKKGSLKWLCWIKILLIKCLSHFTTLVCFGSCVAGINLFPFFACKKAFLQNFITHEKIKYWLHVAPCIHWKGTWRSLQLHWQKPALFLSIFEGVQTPRLISYCRPSSLDALVFGYIAPLLKAPLSSNQLTTHLRRYCENLCTHCNRILQQFFPPTPEGKFYFKSLRLTCCVSTHSWWNVFDCK